MARLGFQVRELLGGLDWWIRDGYVIEGNTVPQNRSDLICGC